jgi:hypothetical protein
MKMSNITIEVEFLAGTDLLVAVDEAKSLARRLDIAYVKYKFNGISFSIGQDADSRFVEMAYKNGDGSIVAA